jgi:hypothetical protein
VWQALAVALLLVASAESAALVVLALAVRDLQRELCRRAAPLPPEREPSAEPDPPRHPIGFRPP